MWSAPCPLSCSVGHKLHRQKNIMQSFRHCVQRKGNHSNRIQSPSRVGRREWLMNLVGFWRVFVHIGLLQGYPVFFLFFFLPRRNLFAFIINTIHYTAEAQQWQQQIPYRRGLNMENTNPTFLNKSQYGQMMNHWIAELIMCHTVIFKIIYWGHRWQLLGWSLISGCLPLSSNHSVQPLNMSQECH